MNTGVYALPGFMAPAAKNWKSQLLTNEDGSVKLCVYVGKPGTKVYYSLGIPGWKWGFIKDAQYFIDKGYPEDVIKEVSKFADYLDEEVTELPEGTVIPDIVINGWPVPITESPIEGKVYWILNIPKFILPAGDTEVQISANGKLIKYTITRPDFSIHYNVPYEQLETRQSASGAEILQQLADLNTLVSTNAARIVTLDFQVTDTDPSKCRALLAINKEAPSGLYFIFMHKNAYGAVGQERSVIASVEHSQGTETVIIDMPAVPLSMPNPETGEMSWAVFIDGTYYFPGELIASYMGWYVPCPVNVSATSVYPSKSLYPGGPWSGIRYLSV